MGRKHRTKGECAVQQQKIITGVEDNIKRCGACRGGVIHSGFLQILLGISGRFTSMHHLWLQGNRDFVL